MRKLVTVVTALAVIAAACGGGSSTTSEPAPGSTATVPAPGTTGPGPGAVEVARAPTPRATTTDVSDGELAELIAGTTRFAYDLFDAVGDEGNALVSPYSVAAALTMAYTGARGDTASEMADVLHLAPTDDRVHAVRNELDLRVATAPQGPEGDDRQPFTIAVANSLWGQQGYPFLEEFLELLAVNYDAGLNLVDFVAATQDARRTINSWVEEQTNGRIADLIPEGVLTTLTRLVIVNAIWFKANWALQFDPADTADGPFTLLDGTTVSVPLMRQNGRFDFAEGDGYRSVQLRYAGDATMTIILPDAGRFEEIRTVLTDGGLHDLTLTTHQVDLTLPRWEFTFDVSLKQVLQELGMVAAFAEPSLPGGADFTGITARRELFVHDVVHKAFIAVDEQGTEATAATAVVIGLESAPPPATMTVDRPFLFIIQHASTGEILFIGQVVDPS